MQPTRRSFFKLAGAAIAAPHAAVAFSATPDAAHREVEGVVHGTALVDLANIFQGTESTHIFSRGNTLPIVTMPFGMAHWTLQSSEAGPWFFAPKERRLQGIRCTHQLSPWLSDYGYATFLPVTGHPEATPSARSSSYRSEETVAHPYFFETTLLRYKTKVELAPTVRCSAMRITYGEDEPGLVIDLPGADVTLEQKGDVLFATVRANAGGVPKSFATYYAISASVPFSAPSLTTVKSRRLTTVAFHPADSKQAVEVRIATSFISAEQAQLNLKNEVEGKSFEELKDAAKQVWEEHMQRAVVEGGTLAQRQVFYSAMYRALLFPRIWHEPDATGKNVHYSPYSGKVTAGVLYADHGYWDVYRAWYPFMSILFPERLGEILQSWVNAGAEGGWLPQFPCPGYRACMTGSLIDAVFGDAAVKDIPGFDLEAAYQLLKKHATQPGDPDVGYGRRGIEGYLAKGYCAADRTEQSVAETVDAAYGDFCIAQVAKKLGHAEDAAMFLKRSGNWRHLYDDKTKFLRGKKEDGSWVTPFDPVTWGDPYVEGSAWQHRWDVPHEPEALMQLMGGPDAFAEQLELMLTQAPDFHVGSYKQEIHEMSEMAAVPFGQYAHSNQPVHHVLYLFAIAGRSDRLQHWVRRVLTELYTVDNFAGDEDTGSMSAWFLLSSMGFYPLCPGKAEYVVGAPLFDRVTLKLPHGKSSVIEASHNSAENCYASSCRLNGKEVANHKLRHADLMAGGTLTFAMTSTPRRS